MNTLKLAQKDPAINANINDPNKKIIVRLVSSGDLVAIDRMKDFKPGYHVKLEAPTVDKPEVKEDNVPATEEEKALFAALKEKGWNNLDKEERPVYQALKAKCE
jgi:hypothetical protein